MLTAYCSQPIPELWLGSLIKTLPNPTGIIRKATVCLNAMAGFGIITYLWDRCFPFFLNPIKMRAEPQYSEDLTCYAFVVYVAFQSQQMGDGKMRWNSLSCIFDWISCSRKNIVNPMASLGWKRASPPQKRTNGKNNEQKKVRACDTK